LTEDWEPNTFHTDSMVPFIILGIDGLNIVKNNGSLRDVAPTILHLLKPEEKEFVKNSFKGTSLVEFADQ